jgi:hypothetical protein
MCKESIFDISISDKYAEQNEQVYTFYRKLINIMTIMMKIVKKRLNLYSKNILMGWGPNVRFFSEEKKQ